MSILHDYSTLFGPLVGQCFHDHALTCRAMAAKTEEAKLVRVGSTEFLVDGFLFQRNLVAQWYPLPFFWVLVSLKNNQPKKGALMII